MLKSFKFIVLYTTVQNFRVINSFSPLLTRLIHNGKFRSDNGDEETVYLVWYICIFSRQLDELKYQTFLQLVICFIFLLLLLILVYFYFTERTI